MLGAVVELMCSRLHSIGCGDMATLYACQTRQVKRLCWGIVVVVVVSDMAEESTHCGH